MGRIADASTNAVVFPMALVAFAGSVAALLTMCGDDDPMLPMLAGSFVYGVPVSAVVGFIHGVAKR